MGFKVLYSSGKTNLLLFLVLLLLSSCSSLFIFRDDPKIEKGLLDLSDSRFDNNQLIKLEGEVEFYWNQLLTPEDFQKDSTQLSYKLIKIPGVWNEEVVNGSNVGGEGFATYRLIIKTKEDGIYGLKFKEVDCAYKVWVNEIQAEVGKVAATKGQMVPSWKRTVVYFNSYNKQIEIVIQVSNFHHRKGGLEDVIYFGGIDRVIRFKQVNVGLDIFLLTIIFFVGISHLFIAVLRRKEQSALMFGILCILMAIRLLTTSEKLVYELLPNISWEFAVRIEYLSYTLVVPVMSGFLYTYYPKQFSKLVLKIIIVVASAFSLTYFVFPVRIFSYTPLAYQLIIILVGFYVIYALVKALKNGEDNASIFLAGFLVFFLVVINDILFYNKILNTSLLMPYGLAFMVVSQSFAITKKQVKAFVQNEDLTSKLDTYNRELEGIVHERTQKIINQKEEIESQADNLRKINDQLISLSQFKDNMTGMVVHDMKNHLSNIILLTSDDRLTTSGISNTNETIQYSAKQLLTLVMNILDIQQFEEAKFVLSKKTISLLGSVESVKNDLAISCKLDNIKIANKVSGDHLVDADPIIIHRVFVNLVSNAIKYSPNNSEVIIKSEEFENSIRFSIIDKGIGVSKEIQDRIFDKFTSYNFKPNEKIVSTGLGLTFCKLAIEAHNGKIGVISEPGKGSEFWFELPKGQMNYTELSEPQVNEDQGSYYNLSESDKKRINRYAIQLASIKYYEVTRINLLLGQIKDDLKEELNAGIGKWLEDIKKAIIYSDKELYESKIKEILEF